MKRVAINDIARLLIDNNREHEMDNTWFKASMDVCMYVGEYGPYDYDDIDFEIEDVMITIDKNELLVSFKYSRNKEKYSGVIKDSDDIEDFIAYGILPDDFDNTLIDDLVVIIEGDKTDEAFDNYYR